MVVIKTKFNRDLEFETNLDDVQHISELKQSNSVADYHAYQLKEKFKTNQHSLCESPKSKMLSKAISMEALRENKS